jgi:hypothetical protein
VATVIGARTATQVAQGVARAAAQPPAALWTDLVAAHLLHPDAPVPAR